MKSVMERLNENIIDLDNWFLFKTYDQVTRSGRFEKSVFQLGQQKGFFKSWLRCDGKEECLF